MAKLHILQLLMTSSIARALVLPSFGLLPEVSIAEITITSNAPTASAQPGVLVFDSFGLIPALSVEVGGGFTTAASTTLSSSVGTNLPITTPTTTSPVNLTPITTSIPEPVVASTPMTTPIPESTVASTPMTTPIPESTVASAASDITPTTVLATSPLSTSFPVLFSAPSSTIRAVDTTATRQPTSAMGMALTTSISAAPISNQKKAKGPFAPRGAVFGGTPNKSLDVPITAVFLVLFIIGAITHFRIHGANSKIGHKFHLSTLMFDFCMVRNITCILRIAWAFAPNNASVELAALIFEFAGVVVVFLVNVFFTQRITRALHGNFGYHPALNIFFLILVVSVPVIIVHNILILVLSSYITNISSLKILRDFQIFGSSYVLFLAFFPIVFLAFATWIPGSLPLEKFGTGRFRTKTAIVLYSAGSLSIGAVIRLVAGVIEEPKDRPAWFDSKEIFYITGFVLEIIVVYLYILVRVDKRFHVPNGAEKPGDYAKAYPQDGVNNLRRNSYDSGRGFARDTSGISGVEVDEKGTNHRGQSLAEVSSTLRSIQLSPDISSYPVEMGNDMLFYVFKKNQAPGQPRRPPIPLDGGLQASRALRPKNPPPPIPPIPDYANNLPGGRL